MNIGLIDVDSHNFPNLCLMKISAWHKRQGDAVEWFNGFCHYDRVYMSKVFDDTISPDFNYAINADEVIKGGTGYGLDNKLPDEIEHMTPDYSLYGITDTAYGFLTRGCPRACAFCIVSGKEGRRSVQVAELDEFFGGGQTNICLLDPNILASANAENLLNQLTETGAVIEFNQGLDVRLIDEARRDIISRMRFKMIHFAWDDPNDTVTPLKLEMIARNKKFNRTNTYVYVLTNFNTDIAGDLERIYRIRDMGLLPYVMIYDRANAPREIKRLQRWVNNPWVFAKCASFDEYDSSIKKG